MSTERDRLTRAYRQIHHHERQRKPHMKPARSSTHDAIAAHFRQNPMPLSLHGVISWGIYRVAGPGLVMRTATYLLPAPGAQHGVLVIDRGLN